MVLRKQIVFERFNRLFRSKPKELVVKEASK